jgi:hypothetical protein
MVNLNNKTQKLDLVPPDLNNLKMDIKKKFNLTKNELQNLIFYANPIVINGTSIKVELKSTKDYNTFVLDQQRCADEIVINCEYKQEENEIDSLKKKIEELEKINKGLTKNYYKLKDKNSQNEKIIARLEKKNFQYKNELYKFITFINKNNINYNIFSSFNSKSILESFYNNNNNNFNNINNINNINNNFNNLVYDCEFIENNYILSVYEDEVKSKNIFEFCFKIKNTGKENWPTDTLLKCIPDESDIFFYPLKITDGPWNFTDENKEVIYIFPVKILFKNYNKFKKENKLSCFLLSDRKGKIGNKIGRMEIVVK